MVNKIEVTQEMVERACAVLFGSPSHPWPHGNEHNNNALRHMTRKALEAALNGGKDVQ